MLKTYSIIPSTFILFLFGLTLISVSPVSAQTVDQLIESIEKLDANDRARVLEYKYSPPKRPSEEKPAAVADDPWDPSMGMRHPARPCMKVNSCGPDKRSADQIARDPFDIINGVRQAEEEATRELAKKMSELAIRSPYLRKLNLQPPYRNYCNSVENRKRECAHRKGKWRGRAFAQNAACVNKYGVEIKTACQSP
mgnify:CR=1 FL=1